MKRWVIGLVAMWAIHAPIRAQNTDFDGNGTVDLEDLGSKATKVPKVPQRKLQPPFF